MTFRSYYQVLHEHQCKAHTIKRNSALEAFYFFRWKFWRIRITLLHNAHSFQIFHIIFFFLYFAAIAFHSAPLEVETHTEPSNNISCSQQRLGEIYISNDFSIFSYSFASLRICVVGGIRGHTSTHTHTHPPTNTATFAINFPAPHTHTRLERRDKKQIRIFSNNTQDCAEFYYLPDE